MSLPTIRALLLALAAAAPVRAIPTTITFDDLTPGTRVTNQYQARGVTFTGGPSLSQVVRTSPPGTMSGTQGLEVVYGGDIPDHPGPLSFSFASPQRRVRVHVGHLYSGGDPRSEAVLKVFTKTTLLAKKYVALGGGVRAITLPIEIDVKENLILRAEVQFLRQEMLDDVYWEEDTRGTETIDSLVFEGAAPPPPPPDDPPVLRITRPLDSQVFFGDPHIRLEGSIAEDAGLGRVTLRHLYLDADPDPAPALLDWAGAVPSFTFPRFPDITRARLMLGRNRLTVEAEDSRGQRHSQTVEVILAAAPVVRITSPADESSTGETTMTVRGTVTKPYGTLRRDQVTVSVSGGPAAAAGTLTGNASLGYSFTASVVLDDRFPSTRNTIRVEAVDEGGARGSASADVTVNRPNKVLALPMDVTQSTLGSYLVAGRRTVARVYPAASSRLPAVTAELHGFRGAVELPGSPLSPFGGDTLAVEAGEALLAKMNDHRKSFNFVLPASWSAAGAITLTAIIDPDNALDECGTCAENNLVEADVRFETGEEIRLQPVKVNYRDGATRRVVTDEEVRASLEAIIRTYPYGEITILPSRNLRTDQDLSRGSDEVLDDILGEVYDTFTCFDGDVNDFGDIFGWLGDQLGGCSWDTYTVGLLALTETSCPGGLAYVPSPACVAEATPWTAAHEVGHCVGQSHAGNSHGEADGGGYDDRFPNPHGTAGTIGFDTTAMAAIPLQAPFPVAPELLDPCRECDPAAGTCLTHDFMSYGDGPYWISSYTHRNIFQKGFTGEVGIFGAGGGAAEAGSGAGGGTDLYSQVLHLSGIIGEDSRVTLRSFYLAKSATGFKVPLGAGSIEARALSAAGDVLGSRRFEPRLQADGDAGPRLISELLPYVEGTAKIEFLLDGEVVASRRVSASAPAVKLLHPNGGETFAADDVVNVRWQASDADGDPLRYGLQYTPDDGKSWNNIAFDLPGTDLDVDLANLPGGDRCRFRVMATDGVLSGRDASDGIFSVAAKEPFAMILYPPPGTALDAGDPVVLEGMASDREEGGLKSGLLWRSSRDGILGKGRRLDVERLSQGTHLIRLEATDDSGATGFAEVEVVVGTGAPVGKSFIRGNANGEGTVNIADPISTLGFLFSGDEAPPCKDAADANDDGKLDISDALYTLGYLFLGGSEPPAPFPQPGIDPTADGLECAE